MLSDSSASQEINSSDVLTVILSQIIVVSPATHLVNPSPEPMSPRKKKSQKLKMLGPLCNQTVYVKTDSKSLYYSMLILKYSLSILKHNKG